MDKQNAELNLEVIEATIRRKSSAWRNDNDRSLRNCLRDLFYDRRQYRALIDD